MSDPTGQHRGGDQLDHATSRTQATAPAAAGESRPAPAADQSAGGPLWPVLIGLMVLVALADQATKAWLVGFLAPGQGVEVVGEWLRLVHGQNNGGLFGLFSGQAPIFAAASVGVIALILLYHQRSGRNPLLSVALGLLLGGAVGNLLDRLTRGYVVDFVDAGIGEFRWYTFNVADMGISGAILLLIVLSIWPNPSWPGRRRAGTAEPAAEPAAEPPTREAGSPGG